MANLNGRYEKGLTLVEVLIAASIILTFVVALYGVFSLYLQTALSNGDYIRATQLAEEGLEAMRFERDSSWDDNIATLALDTDYNLVFEGGNWEATTTEVLIGDYTRVVRLSAVYRDENGDIVSSGGTLDPDTVSVTSSVSWTDLSTTTPKTISTYLTNLYNN